MTKGVTPPRDSGTYKLLAPPLEGKSTMDFGTFFATACPGRTPYPYQRRLAASLETTDLLSVPTGLGKTAAVILGWLYRRRFPSPSSDAATPRRLVYCLPMRTLVEQAAQSAESWLRNLRIKDIGVHQLLGGAAAESWDEHPERDAILIGTQDMLLSRALNRGYGMSRYRWPLDFALLNNDCLWVMDETQLMGVGLTTTAQLSGLRQKLNTFGPVHSIWMSATLDSQRLDTVDHRNSDRPLVTVALDATDRDQPSVQTLLGAKKPLERCDLELTEVTEKNYAARLAELATRVHGENSLTLIILNRVQRAQDLFDEIQQRFKKQKENVPEVSLMHSRFRPCDRGPRQQQSLDETSIPVAGRIIVATQAIEAGVDVSARTLITELAPWASVVQRFGRCNRRGTDGDARLIWIDIVGRDDKALEKLASPYDPELLVKAREHLEKLNDVGLASVSKVKHEEKPPLVHVIRRKDVLDLWDTTPDLAGNDLDVSRYIRETDDVDVQVFWREWDEKLPIPTDRKEFPGPLREELCSVGIGRIADFLKKLKQKNNHVAWRWNQLERRWQEVHPNEARPGMVLLLHSKAGGYKADLGWTGDSSDSPVDDRRPAKPPPQDIDEAMDEERAGEPEELHIHLMQVAAKVRELQPSCGDVSDALWEQIVTAANWHDVGKAHAALQNGIFPKAELPERRQKLWAKSGHASRPNYRVLTGDDLQLSGSRRGFRHELASALAWLAVNPDHEHADLVAFLIAAHHGKVRGSIRSLPNESPHRDPAKRFARGIWDGDKLPPIVGYFDQPRLRDEFGPFKLAYLEMLLRVADWRASGAKW
jgi:CRISPR-associated endonuclease/helicase Cas3